MKNLIIAGDSHCANFAPFTDEILAIYSNNRVALTMDSLSRDSSGAFTELNTFLGSINLKNATLILCVTEVDIRVHFWRDMPVLESRGMDFDEFIQNKVDNFIARVDYLAQMRQISNIVLWGAPASQSTMESHTEALPATGDNITRNILTHKFNLCLIRAITTRQTKLRFSTPFYGMISNDFVTDTSWLRDGVHLKFELRNHIFQLIEQVVDRTAIATFSPKFYDFQNAKFEYLSLAHEQSEMDASPFFRTWMQSDEKSEITLNNKFGQFSLCNSLADIGTKRIYNELVLRRIHE